MTFPVDRPEDYDPDSVFDESENAWTSTLAELTTTGGEKFKSPIVVISDRDKIFFGGL